MAYLQLDRINKFFGDQHAVRDFSLAVEQGEFIVFVGPSGCGKSTLLRLIAGLEGTDQGSIHLAGRDITHLSSAQRDLAMVFQSYALYPHMNVAANMSFALKLAGVDRATIKKKVARAADILGLTPYLLRMPRELSGGQRQRVAIGRAIVREPKVFLFDEPLSNLDAALRSQTRVELASLHRRLGATTIYVTHDQVEAMTLASRVVVLSGGQVQQVATPLELYDRPANLFVAQFIGTPKMNILSASLVPEIAPAGATHLGIRPEDLRFAQPGEGLNVRVELIEALGSETLVYLQQSGGQKGGGEGGEGGQSLVLRTQHRASVPALGECVGLTLPGSALHWFNGDGVRLAQSGQ